MYPRDSNSGNNNPPTESGAASGSATTIFIAVIGALLCVLLIVAVVELAQMRNQQQVNVCIARYGPDFAADAEAPHAADLLKLEVEGLEEAARKADDDVNRTFDETALRDARERLRCVAAITGAGGQVAFATNAP